MRGGLKTDVFSHVGCGRAVEGQGGDAGAAFFIRAQIGKDALRGFGLLGDDELQVMAEGGFDGGDVLVRHADFVGERAEDLFGVLQRGERAGAEALVFGLQLFQDVQAGAFFGLLLQAAIEVLAELGEFLLRFRASRAWRSSTVPRRVWASSFSASTFAANSRQAGFKPGAFLFKLDFFGGKFFEADDVALFLQIQRVDFIAGAASIAAPGKGVGLGLALGFLQLAQFLLDVLHGLPGGTGAPGDAARARPAEAVRRSVSASSSCCAAR